eukprot:scaffold294658_cov33-Tisochrysis_lutea.AAC.3
MLNPIEIRCVDFADTLAVREAPDVDRPVARRRGGMQMRLDVLTRRAVAQDDDARDGVTMTV